jgi:hypothetical protein
MRLAVFLVHEAIMKRLSLITALGILSALSGCRSGTNSELLERELRLLEDEIYTLEDKLNEERSRLDSTQRANQALQRQLRARGAPADLEPPRVEFPPLDVQGPGIPAGNDLPEAPPFRPSVPRPDAPLDQSRQRPQRNRIPHETLPDMPVSRSSRSNDRAGEDDSITDYVVTEVALNPRLTGGLDSDDYEGDDGLLVVIDPRNAQGQSLEMPGDLSIAVIDLNLPKHEQRIARWDFTMEEAAQHFVPGSQEKGMQFKLPWPSDPPESEELHLYVRYLTSSGEKLFAHQPIRISLDGSTREESVDAEDSSEGETLGWDNSDESEPYYGSQQTTLVTLPDGEGPLLRLDRSGDTPPRVPRDVQRRRPEPRDQGPIAPARTPGSRAPAAQSDPAADDEPPAVARRPDLDVSDVDASEVAAPDVVSEAEVERPRERQRPVQREVTVKPEVSPEPTRPSKPRRPEWKPYRD